MSNQPTTLDAHYDAALRRLSPGDTVLMDEGAPISLQEFQLSVRRLVQALRDVGVEPGSLVGYSLPNGLAAFTLPLAISRLGAAFLPLFPMIPDAARCGAFAQARARFVVIPREAHDAFAATAAIQGCGFTLLILEDLLQAEADPLPPAVSSPDSPLLLCTSSGTTGTPKAVFLSQRNVAAALSAGFDLAHYGPWTDDTDFRSMIAFPQSTSGIMILLGTLFAGVCQVFTRSLSPVRFLEIAHAVEAESIAAPPAWYEALLSVPVNNTNKAESVRGFVTGMDFLAPSLVARLRERFPALEAVGNGYGLVETATVFMTWKSTGPESLVGPTSVLTLVPGLGNEISVRGADLQPVGIGEEGELWVRGPSVVRGYLGTSEGFQDGWFRTGDVVRSVASDTIELRGRNKYLIKRGGKSISPLVVQEAVDRTPGVRASAVVGIPHPLYGEMIWAFVVRESGVELETPAIMKTVRAALPAHMVPDRIEFLEAIPLGRGVGKVDRETLIAQGSALLQKLGV